MPVIQGHIAKKRFGQNFLKDNFWIDKIASAIEAQSDDRIIEIGPGQAALTKALMRECGHIECVEIDRELAMWLRVEFPDNKLTVIEADALKLDWQSLLADKSKPKARIVGNLPYNISSPLLFRLLTVADLVADQHFMLQKEVVDRMTAHPGTKAYGKLSVLLQYRYEMTKLFDVPPEAFRPVPKVTSSVVRMVPRAEPEKVDYEAFELVVTQAFGMKRKTLHNNFRDVLSDEQLQAVGIDPGSRAEQIPVSTYVKLVNSIS